MDGQRQECQTPTPGKKPTRILKWKYDIIHDAILSVLPEGKSVQFSELNSLLTNRISENVIEKIGSLNWYITTVKLDMETKGEIERIPGSNPQRLRRQK